MDSRSIFPNPGYDYLDQKFIYDPPEFKEFKKFYRYVHESVTTANFFILKNEADFEDVLQESAYKFCNMLNKGVGVFPLVRDARNCLSKIVRNEALSFLTRRTRRKLREQAFHQQTTDDAKVATAENYPEIEMVFAQVDQALEANPKLFTKKELRFYKLYKPAILSSFDKDLVRKMIMDEMKISVFNYGKLKHKVSRKIGKAFRWNTQR